MAARRYKLYTKLKRPLIKSFLYRNLYPLTAPYMKSLSPTSNFYSEKSAVEKYLSPLSGSNATIVFPLFASFRASSTATLKAAT